MKRLNSPTDDNAPIYIFVLLFFFIIILLSFLATADFKSSGRSDPEEQ
jgi:preprotein translocase subunit SecG